MRVFNVEKLVVGCCAQRVLKFDIIWHASCSTAHSTLGSLVHNVIVGIVRGRFSHRIKVILFVLIFDSILRREFLVVMVFAAAVAALSRRRWWWLVIVEYVSRCVWRH